MLSSEGAPDTGVSRRGTDGLLSCGSFSKAQDFLPIGVQAALVGFSKNPDAPGEKQMSTHDEARRAFLIGAVVGAGAAGFVSDAYTDRDEKPRRLRESGASEKQRLRESFPAPMTATAVRRFAKRYRVIRRYKAAHDGRRTASPKEHGGEGGIRTLDTVSRIHAFQACALSHSATSPQRWRHYSQGRPRGNPWSWPVDSGP